MILNLKYTPELPFKLFQEDETKFKVETRRKYMQIFILNTNEYQEALELKKVKKHTEYIRVLKKKGEYKELMASKYTYYFPAFEEIYKKYKNIHYKKASDITVEEKQFIRWMGYRKDYLDRRGAFYLLLSRVVEKDSENLLEDYYKINDADSIDELYDKFYGSYRNRPGSKKEKSKTPRKKNVK